MKTAISIPDPIFREAEETARRLSVSRSQLFTRAIEAYLEVHRDEHITERLNQVYEKESSAVDPILARMQALSIQNETW
jgi:metal-responsive CopG/Arc/MetJ family transcriptional regulator